MSDAEFPSKLPKWALKAAGAPVSVAMEFAGHDFRQMSQHYTTVSDKSMRRAAESLPDRG